MVQDLGRCRSLVQKSLHSIRISISLPKHIADRELTTNQERARFIAQDVPDYAEKVPTGLVLDSQTIIKVSTALTCFANDPVVRLSVPLTMPIRLQGFNPLAKRDPWTTSPYS